jgi:hypothetical protein
VRVDPPQIQPCVLAARVSRPEFPSGRDRAAERARQSLGGATKFAATPPYRPYAWEMGEGQARLLNYRAATERRHSAQLGMRRLTAPAAHYGAIGILGEFTSRRASVILNP